MGNSCCSSQKDNVDLVAIEKAKQVEKEAKKEGKSETFENFHA